MQRKTRGKKANPDRGAPLDPVATMQAELAYGVALLRPHFPDDDDDTLLARVKAGRQRRYACGRWPTDEELAEQARQSRDADAAERAEQERLEATDAVVVLFGREQGPD
jgi:hypothetical protein